MPTSSEMRRRAAPIALALFAWLLGPAAAIAWDDQYLDRTDKIDPGAGDAVAHNQAVQTIHPWPRYVYRDRININGARIDCAYRRYEANKVVEPKGLSTSKVQFSVTNNFGGSSGGSGGGNTDCGADVQATEHNGYTK